MFGHAHAVFLCKDFATIKGADIARGTLNGVPAVMPGMWGDHLGVVDLVLNNDSGKWQVTQSKAEARPIYDAVAKKSLADEDGKLVAVLKADHDATREFVSKPIGKSADNMYSYLALVQDDPTVQVVNMAQKAYVEHYIQGDPDLAKLPVLSAAAPFKVGGRKTIRRASWKWKRPAYLPQRRRPLSLPEHHGGDEGQREGGQGVAGVLRRAV